MAKDKSEIDYQALQEELETILDDLQRENIDVDSAMNKYERGLEIVQKLEDYLQNAQNRVIELQAKFSKDS